MMTKTETPEHRLYTASWQDGSVDLFAGLALACIGIGWLLDLVAIAAAFPGMMVPLWVLFHRKVIEPRLGYVRFGEARRRRLHRAHIASIVTGCVVLALALGWFLLERQGQPAAEWPRIVSPALPAVLVGFGAGLAALLFAMPRLAFYGLLSVLCGIVVAVLRVEPGWSLLAVGILTTICGALLLRSFFDEFPRLPSEIE